MAKDKSETHENILKAARAEFMKNGFEKASIREIARQADVTSAALYRHCTDKEDLFSQLVEPSICEFRNWRKNHIATKYAQIEEKVSVAELMKNNDIDMIREIIYPHREDFKLILTKAEGTRYENFLHDMVNEDQKEMLKVLDFLKSLGNKVVEVSEKEMHTILSAAYTAMLEPVIHDYTQSETEHCLSVVEDFFMPGWQKLMGF